MTNFRIILYHSVSNFFYILFMYYSVCIFMTTAFFLSISAYYMYDILLLQNSISALNIFILILLVCNLFTSYSHSLHV